MKTLVLFLLVLGSLSVFAATGEDRSSTGPGVMCQNELEMAVAGESSEEAVDGNAEEL